ncbi:hypothetical protein M670_03693 [Schinkia azotoformans MEV2011]|uniref:ATP-dependent Lon protease n=1 Tax=Schinkia azotoformans MEV2011 TaxID=1348973 RepID=A0A072NV59_SCHAZ|nr:hypothetical protein [Schinkia azotoformans]KEF37100.1 hypothetical protein M670_03693 [Schinkia azotoformans MEV2011]MEC1694322.1 ATP-dependent Lon protease [Schinkia azotoformans]MEC1717986.1 ATP-dependent Lon protease [Schinkia azotoformans]MEC1723395.1 ATP-dependent Lon protease [Schinkia azotoformans]MEC1743305.1 ATP-dependent Lon protease [Schinkia azotoformans]
MKLLLSILLAGVFGILIFLGPIGAYIFGAVLVGIIFRSFVLLNDIHKQVIPVRGGDRVKEAYERYLKEKEANEEN